VEWEPEKAIFRSVTVISVYNKKLSNHCNLLAQIEQVQDNQYTRIKSSWMGE